MRSASAKPLVMMRSVRSPLRSSSALVATVVPILTASIAAAGSAASAARPSRLRMPCSAASRYCSGFSESSLWVTRAPSGRRATTSVKVPPRSIQNCHPVAAMPSAPASGGGDGVKYLGRSGDSGPTRRQEGELLEPARHQTHAVHRGFLPERELRRKRHFQLRLGLVVDDFEA